jgi:hypothetical protein
MLPQVCYTAFNITGSFRGGELLICWHMYYVAFDTFCQRHVYQDVSSVIWKHVSFGSVPDQVVMLITCSQYRQPNIYLAHQQGAYGWTMTHLSLTGSNSPTRRSIVALPRSLRSTVIYNSVSITTGTPSYKMNLIASAGETHVLTVLIETLRHLQSIHLRQKLECRSESHSMSATNPTQGMRTYTIVFEAKL